MTHVVLAVDDDEDRAILQAERIRDLDWAPDEIRVTVLHVFTENREGASVSQFGPAREARDVLEDAGIEVTLDERSGEPEVEIVRYAERDADLVCVAGRKRSPAGKAMFGSVSQSIMLDTDLPVLFCPFDE
ncbi:universal stress protein [Natronomonas salina]|uniref:universal stress protein n=1 Tax=Natronomonas salina TaxID=1710540 RepID=UPI0015B63F47|nr:universal stress protein [Natronomonas salina]QLD88333.1 universal stress protein [Natronomonas salina]